MMTRKYACLFTLSLWIVIIGGCKEVVLESQWTAQPVSIDGNDTDWESVPLHDFELFSTSVGLRNDADYFYLLVRTENPVITENYRAMGISLSFTSPNEKKPVLSMYFSGNDTSRPDYDPNDSFWLCLTNMQKSRFRERRSELKNRITVVRGDKSEHVPSDGSGGPAAAMVSRHGLYGYEFKIPIQSERNQSNAVNTGLGEVMGIEIQPGGLESERSKAEASRDNPTGDGGMGRMENFGNRGFGKMPDDGKIKFKVTLADAS